VAEAILTSEKIEELADKNALGAITFPLTILAQFAKYFLMGHRPRHAGDGNARYQKPSKLKSQCHIRNAGHPTKTQGGSEAALP
jgi:hypothetical protein